MEERGEKSMASREYFAQRNAIPGFTFLLILLITNYTPLLKVINLLSIQPLVGAVLGFLPIVAGSAIGAHIQSIWQCYFQRRGAHYCRKPYRILIEEFGLTRNTDNLSKRRVIAFYGFFNDSLLGYPHTKNLVHYMHRRWDLFHTFSATKFSIYLGILFGFVLRLLFIIQWDFGYDWSREFYIHKIFLIPFLLFTLVLQWGNEWILFQYDAISVALIKNPDNRKRLGNVQDLFPKEYFECKKACVSTPSETSPTGCSEEEKANQQSGR